MYIDPTIINWLLIGAASVCAFMVGWLWNSAKNEEIIENTILYLVENGFVKAKRGSDGEIEIIPLNEEE